MDFPADEITGIYNHDNSYLCPIRREHDTDSVLVGSDLHNAAAGHDSPGIVHGELILGSRGPVGVVAQGGLT